MLESCFVFVEVILKRVKRVICNCLPLPCR